MTNPAAPPTPVPDPTPLPRWRLDGLFPDIEGREFAAAMEQVMSGVDRLLARYDQLGIRAGDTAAPGAGGNGADGPAVAAVAAAAEEVIGATNALLTDVQPLAAYLHARLTTDTGDDAAATRSSRLQTKLAQLGTLTARWEAWVAHQGVPALVAGSPEAEAHRFALERAARQSRFRMTEGEEALAALLRPSASGAWAKLHRDVTARLVVDVELPGGPETMPMSAVRGLATHADPEVRRRALAAELAAWEQTEVPLAAALNGAIGERVVLNRRRGWPDDLAAARFTNNVDEPTLDAMHAAVDDALPAFRTYLRAKARLLSDAATGSAAQPDGLAWSDLFAPIPEAGAGSGAAHGAEHGSGGSGRIDWTDAVERVRTAFASYDPGLRALVDRALAEGWIDAEPRRGKVDGAYCLPVAPGESRILLNYDGSSKSVQTLAHELGHAFHGYQLAGRTPWQKTTPMALAETASIFCETLLVESMLATTEAGRDAAVRTILDTDLQGACQVVVDIRSRFRFEQELCRRRAERALTATELCGLMVDAQRATYGDGLADDSHHPYMWAVKGHYFTPFYNWPYTFGLLFGLGLHQRFTVEPDRFRRGYQDLLSRTGMADAATLAASFGIDVRDRAFWDASLAVLVRRIERFTRLADGPGPPPAPGTGAD